MAQTQPQAQPATKYPITAFTLPKSGKARGALPKRFDHTVWIEVDLKELPSDVLRDLLLEALQTKARAAVKKLNPETASEDEIKTAMSEAVEKIKSGKSTGGKAKPKMDEETKAIRREARSILREQFKAKLEASGETENFTPKQITDKISESFKARDAYERNPTKNADKAGYAKAVNSVMKIAAERIKQRTADNDEFLGPMLEEMKAAANNQAQPAKKPTPKKQTPKKPTAPAKEKPAQAPAR